MFRKILVPLDGSQLAEAAIPHAAAVAQSFDAELLLLRVMPVRQRAGAAPLDIIDRRLCRAEAQAYLDALVTRLREPDLKVHTVVVQGQPAEQIVEVLRSSDADLMVLTSHGVGGCTEFPVSGTAHKVVSRSSVSVLMVPTNEPVPSHVESSPTYRRILVGLDGSRRGTWALGPAAVLARRTDAELVLAHVVQIPEVIEDARLPELRTTADRLVRLNTQAAATHLADVKSQIEGPDLRVRTCLEVATMVPQKLAEIAESENVDLVVLTAHGASASNHRPYGAIAVQILADVRRPLLVAQDALRDSEAHRSRRAPQRETALNHQ